MSAPAFPDGLNGARRAMLVDPQGRVLQATADEAWAPEQDAAATAMAVGLILEAGAACGFGQLDRVVVKGGPAPSLTAVRPDAFLRVEPDPARRAPDLEKALAAWASPGAAAPVAEPTPTPKPATFTGERPAAAALAAPAGRQDPWALLRRSLVRGHLTEAAALQQTLAAAEPGLGAEPLTADELRDAMQHLLEGIGSVLADDSVGGARSLRDLSRPTQRNLSIRWLALYWIARAAMGGSGLETARLLVKDVLELSRQLDVEARAVSQLIAAELMARAGQGAKALTWIGEARSRFERSADRWGQGRTWLVEARIHAAAGRDDEAVAAARRARDADPAWDGPPLFLAGRSLSMGDLQGSEEMLSQLRTPAAERLRKLIDAVRQELLSQGDAAEFLRLQGAPPTTQGLRTLERIANAAPRFHQAREALGWMLLRMGKHGAAREVFSWLLSQPLGPGDRALVMLGLSCIASAAQGGERPGDPAGEAAAAPAGAGEQRPPPRLTDSVLGPGSTQPGFAGLDAVFSGRLSVFSLPDLVEFLRSARRTGLLVCSSPTGMGSLRFREGWISGASSPATPSLGELLLRAGTLSSEGLRQVTGGEERPADDLVGEALVHQGLVDAAAVEGALREQIDLTLRELIRWNDGEFAFSREARVEAAARGTGVRVDAQELLLSLFKEMDESTRGHTSVDVEI
jgi:tetratricopeptide (TPR) repeat protein